MTPVILGSRCPFDKRTDGTSRVACIYHKKSTKCRYIYIYDVLYHRLHYMDPTWSISLRIIIRNFKVFSLSKGHYRCSKTKSVFHAPKNMLPYFLPDWKWHQAMVWLMSFNDIPPHLVIVFFFVALPQHPQHPTRKVVFTCHSTTTPTKESAFAYAQHISNALLTGDNIKESLETLGLLLAPAGVKLEDEGRLKIGQQPVEFHFVQNTESCTMK